MNSDEKHWAFTEFLGETEAVKKAIYALKDANVLYGKVYSNEEKGYKRFIQYYACCEAVNQLSSQEEELYNKIALQYDVCIAYSYLGRLYTSFPKNEKHDFSIKYWEWWIADGE